MRSSDVEKITEIIESVVEKSIKTNVNGKIDRLHKEMTEYNKIQDDRHEELKGDIQGIIELYGNSSAFFRGAVRIAKFITAIGGAIVVVWAMIKFIIISAYK